MKTVLLIQPDSFYVSAAVGYGPRLAHADADCLSCHNDPTLQDANGKSIGVERGQIPRQHSRRSQMQRLP